MIRKPVKLYLEQHLMEIGCAKVFTDPKDAGVAKPKEWALVSMPEAAKYETKNEKVTYVDRDGRRTYHYKKSEVTLEASVRIAADNLDRLCALSAAFMIGLSRRIKDDYGYDIELSLGESGSDPADSEVAMKNEMIITVVAVGGVYITREVPLITAVELETEIIRR